MKTYARIDGGMVVEIISPATDQDGQEIPIDERFTPSLVETLVDITQLSPQPVVRDLYDGKSFTKA